MKRLLLITVSCALLVASGWLWTMSSDGLQATQTPVRDHTATTSTPLARAPATRELRRRLDAAPRPVEFRPAVTGLVAVVGNVVDVTGAPVVGAEVQLLARSVGATRGDNRDDHCLLATAFTGRDGKYTVEGSALIPTLLDLGVVADGFARAQVRHLCQSRFAMLPDIVLRAGGTLVGRVIDCEGSPVSGAAVRVAGAVMPVATPRTDSAGHFALEHVATGSALIVVSSSEHLPHAGDTFTVHPGQVTDCGRIVLERGGRLAGRVRDDLGHPVTAATVVATTALALDARGAVGHSGVTSRTTTDEHGEFALTGLPPGPLRVVVRHEHHATAAVEPVDPAEVDRLAIRLHSHLAVAGSVIDARTSQPIDRFAVRARPVGNERRAATPVPTNHAGGAFAIEGLDAGGYVLDVAAPGYAPSSSEPFELIADRTPPRIVVPLQRGGRLRGAVVSPDGVPVAGARVDMSAPDDEPRDAVDLRGLFGHASPDRTIATTWTDDTGAFDFSQQVAGRFELAASAEGHGRLSGRRVELAAGDDHVIELVLPPAGALTGTVFGLDGRPGQVSAIHADGTRYAAPIDADGRYRIEGLPAGSYTTTVDLAGDTDAARIRAWLEASRQPNVLVTEGADTERDLEAPQAR